MSDVIEKMRNWALPGQALGHSLPHTLAYEAGDFGLIEWTHDSVEVLDGNGDSGSLRFPRTSRAWCDRCGQLFNDIRLKCQNCEDFDYCLACYTDSDGTHPGHQFRAFRGTERLGPGMYQFRLDKELEAMRAKSLPLLLRGVSAEPPEHTCRVCSDIALSLGAWHVTMLAPLEQVARAAELETRFEWNIRISWLVEATSMGCAFCALILQNFFGRFGFLKLCYDAERPWWLDPDAQCEKRRETIAHAMKLCARLRDDRFTFAMLPVRGDAGDGRPWLDMIEIGIPSAEQTACDKEALKGVLKIRGKQVVELHAFAAQGNPASADVIDTPPNPSPGSPYSLSQARTWMNDCLKNHGESCSALPHEHGFAKLPSRIIDVSSDTCLRVRESDPDERGQYCALSYQWGGLPEFRLTTETLPSLKSGFSIDNLPATIADAVNVTRNLGVRYLWVDVVCILQDDKDDKAHEVSRMANIYLYSHLTIIAARANSVTEGFLRSNADPDTGLWKGMVPVRYPVVTAGQEDINDVFHMTHGEAVERGRLTYGTIWLLDETDRLEAQSFRDPTDKRCWCLQERLLSPRTLTYGRWPTWRCMRMKASDGAASLNADPWMRKCDGFTQMLLKASKQPQASLLDHTARDDLLRAWYEVVNEYSKRNLSDSNDRLPAISGIATLMSHAMGMSYLAGLWEDTLLHDLMWHAYTQEWLNRPTPQRAPTWSWASVKSEISYDHIDANAEPLAEVLSCRVEGGKAGNFGQIQAGELLIRGKIRTLQRETVLRILGLQRTPPPLPANILDIFRQIFKSSDSRRHGERSKEISMEEVAAKLPSQVFSLVTYRHDHLVVNGEHQSGIFYSGLLLQAVDAHYERIGCFKQNLSAPEYDWGREMTISIQ